MKAKRNILLLVVGCIFILLIPGAKFGTLDTVQAPYYLARAEADEDAADLASCLNLLTSGDFANKSANAFLLPVAEEYTHYRERLNSSAINAVQIIICGGDGSDGDPDNKTFSFAIFGYRIINGPAELVCYGNGTIGTQSIVKYLTTGVTATNRNWADTLSITSGQVWFKEVATIDAGGANRVAKIIFDACGYTYFDIYYYDASGTGAEAGDLTSYYSFL